MDYLLLETRAYKKGFVTAAGEDYRDINSEVVKGLISEGKSALLGLQQRNGFYTILGQTECYSLTTKNIAMNIKYYHLLKVLKENAMQKGKAADFEFLRIGESGSIWLKNAQTMTAIWGLMQYIIIPR